MKKPKKGRKLQRRVASPKQPGRKAVIQARELRIVGPILQPPSPLNQGG
jgi:hypothetical protein